MWNSVIWEVLPCGHCTACSVLVSSVEQAGPHLLPDRLTDSSASHFCLHLSFFVNSSVWNTHYNSQGALQACRVLPFLLEEGWWRAPSCCLEISVGVAGKQFVALYPKGCCLHVKYTWDIRTKIKVISYTPRIVKDFFFICSLHQLHSSEWEGKDDSAFLLGTSLRRIQMAQLSDSASRSVE